MDPASLSRRDRRRLEAEARARAKDEATVAALESRARDEREARWEARERAKLAAAKVGGVGRPMRCRRVQVALVGSCPVS